MLNETPPAKGKNPKKENKKTSKRNMRSVWKRKNRLSDDIARDDKSQVTQPDYIPLGSKGQLLNSNKDMVWDPYTEKGFPSVAFEEADSMNFIQLQINSTF